MMVTYTKAEAVKAGIYIHDIDSICEFHMRNPDQTAVMHSCKDCVYIWDDECRHGSDDFCDTCDPQGKFIHQCPQCKTVGYSADCQYCNEQRHLPEWNEEYKDE